MKIKHSFVTNSSSTSFFMVAEPVKKSEIDLSTKDRYMAYNGESVWDIFSDQALLKMDPEEEYKYFRVFYFTTGETIEETNDGDLCIEDLDIPEGVKAKVISGYIAC